MLARHNGEERCCSRIALGTLVSMNCSVEHVHYPVSFAVGSACWRRFGVGSWLLALALGLGCVGGRLAVCPGPKVRR